MSGEADAAIVLASASPRRVELLTAAGLTFVVEPGDIDETPDAGERPPAYVRRMAAEKARSVAARRRAAGDSRPVLGADTTVVVADEILGKPADRDEARRMLELLSGREHEVITGYCIVLADGSARQEEVTTLVRFKRLHPDELSAYLDGGEWADKAGGYAVQGRAAALVEAVFGSYTNVVGLPLCQVVEALRRAGVHPAGDRGGARQDAPGGER